MERGGEGWRGRGGNEEVKWEKLVKERILQAWHTLIHVGPANGRKMWKGLGKVKPQNLMCFK